jgi:hypothetical protein
MRDQLHRLLGDLERQERARFTDAVATATVDFTPYVGRPVAFVIEVLRMRLLAWQRSWLNAFHDHKHGQYVLVTCNGAGKTGMMGPLLLYIALVLGGQAIYFSASEKQTRTQMKASLERLVARIEDLPDDTAVYNHGITFDAGGAVILATAADVNAMQGHHGETLCIVADEAQHLDDDQLVALQSCVVADDNWLVLTGNALNLGGPFHRVATTADPSWRQTKVSALEVLADPEAEHIRGLVTKKGVGNIRQTWGEMSAHFQSRVMANFPAQPADAMFPEARSAGSSASSAASASPRCASRRSTSGRRRCCTTTSGRCSSTPRSGGATRSTTRGSTPRSSWTRSRSGAASRTVSGSWATRSSRSMRRGERAPRSGSNNLLACGPKPTPACATG